MTAARQLTEPQRAPNLLRLVKCATRVLAARRDGPLGPAASGQGQGGLVPCTSMVVVLPNTPILARQLLTRL